MHTPQAHPLSRAGCRLSQLALATALLPGPALAAPLLISPLAFDFGDVGLGTTSANQSVTIRNVSSTPQTLDLAGGAAGLFGGFQNCQGRTLAPGEFCEVTYQFTPASLGAVSGFTNLEANGQAVSFSFSGAGVKPFLITPLSFDFGSVPVGTTSPGQTVTITNVSDGPQTLDLAGGAAGVFGGFQNCQGRTLAPGESCQVTYEFTPAGAGATTDTTTLQVNGQTVNFDFAGTGGSGNDNFLISPRRFDFGNVAVGTASVEQTVTITNISGSPQTLGLAGGAAGEFGGVQNCQGRTLAPGESCQVTYQFTPADLGPHTDTTNLEVNGQAVSFSFSGEGVRPFLISPLSFDFGEIALGTTSPEQSVTVMNVSDSPLALSLAGGAAGVFGGFQNCQGVTLAPSATCQITYAFTPTALGPVDETTSLEVNGQAARFAFRGIGVGAQSVPEPGTLLLLAPLAVAMACTRRRRL